MATPMAQNSHNMAILYHFLTFLVTFSAAVIPFMRKTCTPFGINLKMAIKCPQGSGTLRQQLLMMH